jgi:hypothetical protein
MDEDEEEEKGTDDPPTAAGETPAETSPPSPDMSNGSAEQTLISSPETPDSSGHPGSLIGSTSNGTT